MPRLSALEKKVAAACLAYAGGCASDEGPLEGFAEDNGLTVEQASAICARAYDKLTPSAPEADKGAILRRDFEMLDKDPSIPGAGTVP